MTDERERKDTREERRCDAPVSSEGSMVASGPRVRYSDAFLAQLGPAGEGKKDRLGTVVGDLDEERGYVVWDDAVDGGAEPSVVRYSLLFFF